MADAVIVDRDTLRALGLRYLLGKFFGMSAVTAGDVAEVEACHLSGRTLFFVTPECYVAAREFFLPRGHVTVMLSGVAGGDIPSIDPAADESSLIDAIGRMIEERREADVPAGAELSQRETDVLRLVAMGYINKEIADTLSISVNTVLSHRKNITAKLGIRSASGLGFYAVMNGIVDGSAPRR